MMEEDEIPVRPVDLERLSVEELQEKIIALKAEIRACEAQLQSKLSHRSEADALFGGSG